ncbi:MAG: hypothetical protein IT348_17910 [Candidatus Eisenbacteria bacterium]|nr:hypothetical protein [Candidatus Eisenbacteria bacterium]
MKRLISSALATTFLMGGILVRPSVAAWPHDPHNGNVAVSLAPSTQTDPVSVSDGAGGTIITWRDYRGGTNYDIYAQRVSSAGVPLWTTGGVALCTAPWDQTEPVICSDGAGGAIVSWLDRRNSNFHDIYAQRINAAGVVQWTANGVPLCTALGEQLTARIVSDGSGGAIVAWYDARSGNADVYAQRISVGGVVQWAADGVALCTAVGHQSSTAIVSDGTGGAIVAWGDGRSLTSYDLYAQRISGAGVPQWTGNGVAVCTAADSQGDAVLASDGVGGAVVAWFDNRNANYDIYAQRINASGAMLWAIDGVVVCNASGDQQDAEITQDGTGGLIAAWRDHRSGSNPDIYAQRIAAGGTAVWTANGVALCSLTSNQYWPVICSDNAGGAVVGWWDERNGSGNADIYAQRIGPTGFTQWIASGAPISLSPGTQQLPSLCTDGSGGAIIAWTDGRNPLTTEIYAQRIELNGQLGNPEPVITGVKDVKNDQGGYVKLSWTASYLDADPLYLVNDYRVWRSVPASALAAEASRKRGVTPDSDVAVASGGYLVGPFLSAGYAWEFVGIQSAATLSSYSLTTTTTSDSIAGSNPRTAFMIEARASTSLSADRWFSAPDSGYSVDNLPPAAPAPLTGQFAAGTTSLHWYRNTEADLAGYRLYRGSSVAFVPGPANFVGELADTGFADAAGAPYVYKLTALDEHGNESAVATLVPSGTTGIGDGAAPALAFAAPSPNPARGAATLRYALSRAGHVRLSAFDAAGRRVATLRDGEQAAGEHAVSFDLRDAAGRALASGLYLVQLEAEGRVLTRRLAAIR